MLDWENIKWRKLNLVTHRDLGYFFSFLILIYCVSGLALNHADDWNPDFIITKDTLQLDRKYARTDVNEHLILNFNKLVGEESHRIHDFPTHDQVKIYYKDASLHVYMDKKMGVYERLSKRAVFYQSNVLHRNSLKGWKWASDIFAILLILITVTGLFVIKGKNGISGRGKWLVMAGLVPPIAAIVIQAIN
jgi:hypothetical protein